MKRGILLRNHEWSPRCGSRKYPKMGIQQPITIYSLYFTPYHTTQDPWIDSKNPYYKKRERRVVPRGDSNKQVSVDVEPSPIKKRDNNEQL